MYSPDDIMTDFGTAGQQLSLGLPVESVFDALAECVGAVPGVAIVRQAAPDLLQSLNDESCDCALLPVHACVVVERGRVIPGLGFASLEPVRLLEPFLPAPLDACPRPLVYALWAGRFGAPMPRLRQALALGARAACAPPGYDGGTARYQLGADAMEAARRLHALAIANGRCPKESRLTFC